MLEKYEKRQRGRPRTNNAPPAPSGPVVFLTREQLAERWHMKPDTITKNYRKMGLKKIMLNRRWLVALSQVEEIERKAMGK